MRIELRKQSIPWVMAAGRAALGPFLIVGVACSWNGITLASIVVTALLSDIFDGMLARRWCCDTAGVRLFDSMADTVFYLCVAVALWISQPAIWRHYAGLLIPLLSLEVLRFGVDFAKFGKPASYHSYLAKCWGLTMAVGVIAVFWLRSSSQLLAFALVLGIACNVEGLVMSAILPAWRKDVKTIRAAWQLHRQIVATVSSLRDCGSTKLRSKQGFFTKKAIVAMGALALVLGVPLAAQAFAVRLGKPRIRAGRLRLREALSGFSILPRLLRWSSSSKRPMGSRARSTSPIRTSSTLLTTTMLRTRWGYCHLFWLAW